METRCPFCKTLYEVEDKYAGQSITCPTCSQEFYIVEEEKEQQPLPAPSQSVNIDRVEVKEIKINVKQGAIVGAFITLILGVIFNLISNLSFLIYIPLYLACFILSIIALSQKRIISGIISLLLSIILPPIIIFSNIYIFAKAIESTKNKILEDNESTESDISQTLEKIKLPQEEIQSNNRKEHTDKSSVTEKVSQDQSIKVETKTASASDTNEKNNGKKKPDSKNIYQMCGFTFGDIFDLKGNSLSENNRYSVTPKNKFMIFTEYYVTISPLSHTIYEVVMIARDTNSDDFNSIIAVLENHYGIKAKEDLFGEYKRFSFDNGNIIVKNNTLSDTIYLYAESTKYSKLADQEKKNKAIQETDTSAL